MNKMFLSSSFADSVEIFQKFIGKDLENRTVTFIPTASIVEEITYYIDAAKEAFKNLGMKLVILDIADTTKEEIKNTIEKNDFIYISGGNSFFLLQELKKKQVDEIILQEINKGKVYIGESAGSIIMAPNIEYISVLDDKEKAPDLLSYEGLNALSKYPLPHLNNEYLGEAIEQIIQTYGGSLNLLPITDIQAILVESDQLTIV
ncbi:Type 1 glutamine amidotransferase-like domain-containing protein [Neisseria sp. Ec49-e6-T10]|uniref:Type 1 glutamine amidotransferase-like domain-containing protein n=1 Tax=Neisseria sp. Ec49-e6-T10 TaxID=3140744 RepID=UPI003EC0DE0D